MIVKVKSYKKMGAAQHLLEYVLNDRKRLFDKKGRSFVVTQNLKGQEIHEWVQELNFNETFRAHKRKNNSKLTMEILSFHRGDSQQITLGKLKKITKEYMRLRNPNGIFVAAPHFDKKHWHVHIIAGGVEYRSGKSLRMALKDFGELKQSIQSFQKEKYPELSHSIVRHGRRKGAHTNDREYQYKLRTGKKTKREEVIEFVKSCSQDAKTKEEFFARLKACKLQPYVRGKVSAGVEFEGRRYRFTRLGINIEQFINHEREKQHDKHLKVFTKKEKEASVAQSKVFYRELEL